ncbi:hypothetical protein NX059_010055 [Plenodomus lindquistii]|nr:hypothetical protein NX059_010055 [Plenodomus lindquistii]
MLIFHGRLREPGDEFSLEDPAEIDERYKPAVSESANQQSNHKSGQQSTQTTMETSHGSEVTLPIPTAGSAHDAKKMQTNRDDPARDNPGVHGILRETRKPSLEDHLMTGRGSETSREATDCEASTRHSESESEEELDKLPSSESDGQLDDGDQAPGFVLMEKLMPNASLAADSGRGLHNVQQTIEQSPLLAECIVSKHASDLVPQFGFLGCLHEDDTQHSTITKLFHNTNVPFSAFICGVQGSGKSHTTATMLENALIRSKHVGNLKAPASVLVFSYSDWVDGGAGFTISEATHLARPHPDFPKAKVKNITVLVSPSNNGIRRCYERPNVRVVPFRLNAKTLNISTLLTLMAVNETSTVPLYMARVEAILRSIAMKSPDGSMDYRLFKQLLAKEKFDAVQSNMLEMRLNLLESFLDLTGTATELKFPPGAVTIMDLSDSFVTPNTACILFKLGLDQFVHSTQSTAKLVVLDEAHKYMLDSPGSTLLNDRLKTAVRLQRHEAVRVIVSTQEPTISTDLIALCSVTVIHRFTSPTWYAALRRHISAMGDDDRTIMRRIEGLETGEALVYCPNAVLGKDDTDALIKATGRLMNVRIRKRITADGGESIMAV